MIQQPTVIPGPAPPAQPIIIQVVHQPPAGSFRTISHYKARAAVILGGLQIFLGALSIAMNSAAIHVNANGIVYISYGIWSPVIWFVAGAFGIASGCNKNMCMIITTMVMSIIAAVTITYYLPFACLALREETEDWRRYDTYYGDYICTSGSCRYEHDPPIKIQNPEWTKRVAFESMMVITCIVEGIVAILASVLCCKAVCCGTAPNVEQSNVRYVPVSAVGPQQVVIPTAGASYTSYAAQAPASTKMEIAQPASAPAYSAKEESPPPYNPDA